MGNLTRNLTKEEIQAKIQVLDNIGGYTIEIDELKEALKESKSITDLQNESYKSGYEKASETAKLRREKLLEHNRKLYKSIATDFEDIDEKGILYKSDLLKMPLPAETVNDLQDWFLEMCELV